MVDALSSLSLRDPRTSFIGPFPRRLLPQITDKNFIIDIVKRLLWGGHVAMAPLSNVIANVHAVSLGFTTPLGLAQPSRAGGGGGPDPA